MKDYIKYYNLEQYLFDAATRHFKERNHLTPEDFLAIVIWKRNASKTQVIRGIRSSGKTVQSLTEEIYRTGDREGKMKILLDIKGLGLAIASAILTVLYPEEFTVIDYRVINSLKALSIPIAGNPTNSIEDYFSYLDSCKKEAKKHGLSLRDFDRALWGKDFYEGAKGLKEIARDLSASAQ